MKTIGSKREVYNGTARRTAGGLTKSKLMKNRRGKVVSKKQHAAGLKAVRRLKRTRVASGARGRGRGRGRQTGAGFLDDLGKVASIGATIAPFVL